MGTDQLAGLKAPQIGDQPGGGGVAVDGSARHGLADDGAQVGGQPGRERRQIGGVGPQHAV
jgi:hypothetical protein